MWKHESSLTKGKHKEPWFNGSLVLNCWWSHKKFMDSDPCDQTITAFPLQHLNPWCVLHALIVFLVMLSPVCLLTWISESSPFTVSLWLYWHRHHLKDLLLKELLILKAIPLVRLETYLGPRPHRLLPTPIICTIQKTGYVRCRGNKVMVF